MSVLIVAIGGFILMIAQSWLAFTLGVLTGIQASQQIPPEDQLKVRIAVLAWGVGLFSYTGLVLRLAGGGQ